MAEEERAEMERYKAGQGNPDGLTNVAPTSDEKFGAAAVSRPLLDRVESASPPGTPEGQGRDPYSDGFSALDSGGYTSPSMRPSAALPEAPGSQPTDGAANNGEALDREVSNPFRDHPGGSHSQ